MFGSPTKQCFTCDGTGRYGHAPFGDCGSCEGTGVRLTASGLQLLKTLERRFPKASYSGEAVLAAFRKVDDRVGRLTDRLDALERDRAKKAK